MRVETNMLIFGERGQTDQPTDEHTTRQGINRHARQEIDGGTDKPTDERKHEPIQQIKRRIVREKLDEISNRTTCDNVQQTAHGPSHFCQMFEERILRVC